MEGVIIDESLLIDMDEVVEEKDKEYYNFKHK